MANFRLLPSGNWNAQVRIKGKPPQSKTFKTKAEAESWAKQLEAVIGNGVGTGLPIDNS